MSEPTEVLTVEKTLTPGEIEALKREWARYYVGLEHVQEAEVKIGDTWYKWRRLPAKESER